MKRNINVSGEGTPSQNTPESVSARVHHGARREHVCAHDSEKLDTSPCNTVSNKYNSEYFQPLRWGIDSLYLSFAGELHPEIERQLEQLKKLAQSDQLDEQALAQLKVGEHLFEVKDKSTGMFAYTLVDNCFRINISRSRAKSLPMAYAQISSEYLTHKRPDEIVFELQKLLSELGNINSSASVSRIDLFVDFGSNESMESWDRHAWVTRSDKIDQYSIKGMFSGWTIGLGSPLAGRLYDKILEIVTSKKDYLVPLWKQAGWNGDCRIWRMEFEFKRELLRQINIKTYEDAKQNLNGLWSYATTNWLRLTLPNIDDQNRSRWALHPLWGYIAAIDFETFGGDLSRTFSAQRVPSDQRLFSHGFSVLSSFMAREGLTDFGAGLELYCTNLYHYVNNRSMNEGSTFEGFIGDKVAVKAKLFNSILNKQKELDRQHAADDYRRMSDGE